MNIFKKNQGKIIFMVVVALVLQIAAPLVGDFSFADEKENIETEEAPASEAGKTEQDTGQEEKEAEEDLDEPEEPGQAEDQDHDEELKTYTENIQAYEHKPDIKASSGGGRDLSPKIDYGIYFYKEVDEFGNPILNNRIESGEINLGDLADKKNLFFGVEFGNTEDFTFQNGDYLNTDISSLLKLDGFKDGVEDLKKKEDIKLDGEKFAEYWVEDGKLKVLFTDVENVNPKNIFYNIGFKISEIIKNGSIIEEVEFTEPTEKNIHY